MLEKAEMKRAEVMRESKETIAYRRYVAFCKSLDLPAAPEVTYHYAALQSLTGPNCAPTICRWDIDHPRVEAYHVEHRVTEDSKETLEVLEEIEGESTSE